MGKAQPINSPKPGGSTDPVDEGEEQGIAPPSGDRPDPFIRGLGNDPDPN